MLRVDVSVRRSALWQLHDAETCARNEREIVDGDQEAIVDPTYVSV